MTAANVDKRWIGTDAEKVLTERLGMPVTCSTTPTPPGSAEVRFGAGKDRKGVVVMITLGTGIGCGMFLDGKLVPNTELGHIEIDGKDAETLAADSVRERKGSELEEVRRAGRDVHPAARRARCGPTSSSSAAARARRPTSCFPLIDVRPEVVPATLLNEAGIVGAAVAAADGRDGADSATTRRRPHDRRQLRHRARHRHRAGAAPATARSARSGPRTKADAVARGRGTRRASTSRRCCSTSPMPTRATRCIDDIGTDLYGLVNNAGYGMTGAIEDVTDDEARHLLETMVIAPMRLARLVLPGMRNAGRGRIVNVSSIMGLTTTPLTGWYQGAKHALEAVSDALRIEVAGDGMQVVARRAGRLPHRHLGGHGARHRQARRLAIRHGVPAQPAGHELTSPIMGEPQQCAKVIATAISTRRPTAALSRRGSTRWRSRRWTGSRPPRSKDRVIRIALGL